MEEAGISLTRATALYAQAGSDAARARALHPRGAVPLQFLERAELSERMAERDMVAAERRRHAAGHDLDQARAVLAATDMPANGRERFELRAPVSGRVLRVFQESEAVVASGAPLLELGDPADLEVVADILTTEAVRIMPGAPVILDRWGGPAPLHGRVRLVEPSAFTRVSALGVEEQRVWTVIDIVDPPARWKGLGDGFRVDARIIVETMEDAVLVPVNALFRRGAGWSVFVARDGVARERQVNILHRAARDAVVFGGLVVGETVVLFPPSGLTDGGRVTRAR